MAWNEPGNNGNDPWGGGRRGGDQGPPDIDEVIKNLSKKVNGLFEVEAAVVDQVAAVPVRRPVTCRRACWLGW